MAIELTEKDRRLIDQYLRAVIGTLGRNSRAVAVYDSLSKAITMIADGDEGFRDYLAQTIMEIQDE